MFHLFSSIILIFFAWYHSTFLTKFQIRLRKYIYEVYISKDLQFFSFENSANILKNIVNEINFFHHALSNFLIIITEIFIILGTITVLMYINFYSTSFVLTFFIIFFLIYNNVSKKFSKNWGLKRFSYLGIVNKNVLETLDNLKLIQLGNKENYFLNNFNKNQTILSYLGRNFHILNFIVRPTLEIIIVSFVCIYFLYRIYYSNIESEIVALIAIYTLAAFRLMPSITKITSSLQSNYYGTDSVNKLYEEIKKPILKNNLNLNTNKFIFNEKIIFENIYFKYNQNDKHIFKNLNITIKKNTFIGLSGKSGSGKSTFINLFLGFLKPTKGKIYVDNRDLAYEISAFKKSIGYVPQNIFLLDDTIKANVAFGVDKNNISNSQVHSSLKKAQLSDFIDSLEHGIETNVGENGSKLSGGQIQRIALARSLYFNPDILILDEATSSLDSQTELSFIDVIKSLKGELTILMASHNNNILKYCDSVYEVRNNNFFNKIPPNYI